MTAAVVLAAGKSRRMGTQKLLLPFAGQPLIVHIVSEVLRSGVDRVLVVIGSDSHAVRDALAALPVIPVANPQADGDMLSSIRCGLTSLPPECASVLLVPGDQPGITRDLIARLIAAQQRTGKSIVVPVCNRHRGHPVLISMTHREKILTRYEGTGLRGLLRDHPGDIAEVAVDDPDALADVDFPEDYARLVGTATPAKPEPK